MRILTIAGVVAALTAPAIALAAEPHDPLAEPARTVVADCQDNGQLDTTYDRPTLDKAEFQAVHYGANAPDFDNPEYRRPWEDCGPMIDEALVQTLGSGGPPVTDCFMDGRVEGTYSNAALDQADQVLPRQWAESSDCQTTLHNAPTASEKVSAAAFPQWATKALIRAGARTAGHKVKLRTVRRHGTHSFYGQMRWPVRKRGACYAEAITRKVGKRRRLYVKVTGRYCTGTVG